MPIYNFLLTVAMILSLPFWLIVVLWSEKRRKTFLYRMGIRFPRPLDRERFEAEESIWVHALSVGEVLSALPLARHLKQRYPGRPVVFSASTLSGFEIANREIAEDVDGVVYFPYDHPWCIRRGFSFLRPAVICIVETDIWPNFLRFARKRHIPVIWANARVSEDSFKGYMRFSWLFSRLFRQFSWICPQSETDRSRVLAVGADPQQVTVLGNFKFDQLAPPPDEHFQKFKRILVPGAGQKLFIAGSTHEGEEEIVLAAFLKARETISGLRLILAPRHPKRTKTLMQLVQEQECSAERLSQMLQTGVDPPDVIVVDGMGALRGLYALSDVAFVGGSLVNAGGHNPLEPATFKLPVLFGPDMSDFAEISELLLQHHAAIVVHDATEMAAAIQDLLADPQVAKDMGERAYGVLRAHRGAIQKTADLIGRCLQPPVMNPPSETHAPEIHPHR